MTEFSRREFLTVAGCSLAAAAVLDSGLGCIAFQRPEINPPCIKYV